MIIQYDVERVAWVKDARNSHQALDPNHACLGCIPGQRGNTVCLSLLV